MPIIADDFVDPIRDDAERYLRLIEEGKLIYESDLEFESDGEPEKFRVYAGSEDVVNGDCRLVVLRYKKEIVYSCYYKLAQTTEFGLRAVQIEVRQERHGLARKMMHDWFLKKFDSLRCDLASTRAGKRMWQKFCEESLAVGHKVYGAEISIDHRVTEHWADNQNSNLPEEVINVERLTAKQLEKSFATLWHDNRQGNIKVLYVKR